MFGFPAQIGLGFGRNEPAVPVIDYDSTAEATLQRILIDTPVVSNLIGTRIYPNIVPQKAPMPAVTYQQISGPRLHDMQGAVGMCKARYQINCWAASYAKAKELAEVVRLTLDGYSSAGTIKVIHLANEGDLPKTIPGIDELTRYGKRLDFFVWFTEQII
jgi:hypothetical protein